MLFIVGFAPILPNIVLFCLNVKNFALTTSIEQLKDDKLAQQIERKIKARCNAARLVATSHSAAT